MMSMALIAITSCSDDNDVYLSDRKFVRIDQQSIYLTVGEKFKFTATVDDITGESCDLKWSVLDPAVATAEALDNNAVSITAVAAGSTIVKVETADGKLRYFTDLTVTEGKRPLRVLSIGSGMAYEASAGFLHDIAAEAGVTMVVGNVYLEGATFEDHVANITGHQSVYTYNCVGNDGSEKVLNNQSIKSVISSENWDCIVYEESMALAGMTEGYRTALPELISLIDGLATNPGVKYWLHQPWAYARLADAEGYANYDRDQIKMYNAIVTAVNDAKARNNIAGVIPVGTAIQNGRTSYIGEGMLRDDTHLSADIARYTAACTWYGILCGTAEVKFSPATLINYDTKLARQAALAAVNNSSNVTALTEYADAPARIYIDFGAVESPAPFNNYRFPGDPAVTNLRDDRGDVTTVSILADRPFTGMLDRGLENTLGYPTTASQDMFFCDGIGIAVTGFRISGLNKGEKYAFNFYGHINDSGTQTLYTARGKNEGSAALVNDYNPDRVAAVKGIEPDDDGVIYIDMTFGPDNRQWAKFYGINVMVIMSEG